MNIFRTTSKYFVTGVLAGVALLAFSTAHANEKYREERATSIDEIYEIIERGLPKTLTEDNSGLAKQLLAVKIGEPLVDNLKLDNLLERLFETTPELQGECDPRRGKLDCLAAAGKKAGKGSYAQLQLFSKNSEANVRFAKRPATDGKLVPATLDDREAYEHAVRLIKESFAVSPEEIPVAPKNARNPYPVRTVNIALARDEKAEKVIPVEKLVSLPRGLYAGELGWVPGPGEWTVSVNDEGINTASVRNWADMTRYGEGLRPEHVKSRSDLVEELVQRFKHEGIQKLALANSHIAIVRLEGAEVPEPVLRVFASPQEREVSEEEQAQLVSTAGVVFDLPLFAQYDESQQVDD